MADWSRVRALFDACLDLEPRERSDFLAAECAEDVGLRAQVEELLVADESASESASALESGLPLQLVEEELQGVASGQRIGSYRIKRVLGTGGMSTVYLAEQDHPRREVAVKTMRLGAFAEAARRRFGYESEILGRLRHPAIAQVYEAGTWKEPLVGEEIPFFALEYVHGAVPLDRYVADQNLDLEATLTLFAEVCDAVHHGHQIGIIHRDLKPANVLVDGDGRPKIIDFGIARITDSDLTMRSMQTQTGHVLGTLRYMAPEQLDGNVDEVDTRIDVYALGVMLYELLAGEALVDPGTLSLTAFATRVRDIGVVRPSRATGGFALSGAAMDLDWVTGKALQAEKKDRYNSVSELASDLRRFLANEPVSVGPPTTRYYLRKFVRRNKALVAGVAAVMLALLAGIVATTWQLTRANEAVVLAQREAKKANTINDFFNDLLKLADPNDGRYRSRASYTIRDALDASAALFPKLSEDPEVEAQARFSIGNAYKSLGELEKAEDYIGRCIELRRQSLGDSHPDLADAILSRGALRAQRRDVEGSIADYRAAETVFRAHFGEVHEKVGICILNVGTALAKQGKIAAARTDMKRAQSVFERMGSNGERFLAVCLPHQGNLAYRTKDYDEAERLLRASLAMFEKVNKPWHPYAIGVHTSLGRLLHRVRGKVPEAKTHYDRSLEISEGAYGVGSKQSVAVLRKLAEFYGAIQETETARSQLQRAVEILQAQEKPDAKAIEAVQAELAALPSKK